MPKKKLGLVLGNIAMTKEVAAEARTMFEAMRKDGITSYQRFLGVCVARGLAEMKKGERK
jgi:ribosome-associated toxin RatA of RatAB toxin-antitoxin module